MIPYSFVCFFLLFGSSKKVFTKKEAEKKLSNATLDNRYRPQRRWKKILHRRQNCSSHVHLKLVVLWKILLIFLKLLFEVLQFPHWVRGGNRYSWDLRQTARRSTSDGWIPALQKKFPVVDDAGSSGRCGEQSPPGCLAVAVGQLGPVFQGEDPGGNGAALHLLGGRHDDGFKFSVRSKSLQYGEEVTLVCLPSKKKNHTDADL